MVAGRDLERLASRACEDVWVVGMAELGLPIDRGGIMFSRRYEFSDARQGSGLRHVGVLDSRAECD